MAHEALLILMNAHHSEVMPNTIQKTDDECK